MVKKKDPMEIHTKAHNRMAGLADENDEYFKEHGHREAQDHTQQSVDQIAEDLISVAKRIYDYRIAVALGERPKEALNRGFIDYQQYIISLVEPMIINYQQTKNIDAKSANQVIALLGRGKVTPKEAIELLNVVGKTIEVEEKELRKLLQQTLLERET